MWATKNWATYLWRFYFRVMKKDNSTNTNDSISESPDSVTFEAELLKNPQIKKEYDALEPKYKEIRDELG